METGIVVFLFTAVFVLGGGVYWFVNLCIHGPANQKDMRVTDISGGSISTEKISEKYHEYCSFFGNPKKFENKASQVGDFVDTYYNLVTDIYEWSWGLSFHYAPSFPGKSAKEANRIHEETAADFIRAKPGQKILDMGCGVGGPMLAIASHSRANIVGITSTEHQVKRARHHIRKAGLDSLCEVVGGNFLEMPFEDESFDGAYAIEATCHAPCLEDAYREVFRVLKPGALYVSYETVRTSEYKAEDPEHVELIQKIESGFAIRMRSYTYIAATARKVGFEVVEERNLGAPPAGPWWKTAKKGRIAIWMDYMMVSLLVAFRVVPSGTGEVTRMLIKTSQYVGRAGELGIMTPMHMILCRRP